MTSNVIATTATVLEQASSNPVVQKDVSGLAAEVAAPATNWKQVILYGVGLAVVVVPSLISAINSSNGCPHCVCPNMTTCSN